METRSKKSKENTSDESGGSSRTEDSSRKERTTSTEISSGNERTTSSEGTDKTMCEKSKNKPSGSHTSQTRRAELQARIELQQRVKERAIADEEIARAKLELIQLDSEQEIDQDIDNRATIVHEWMDKAPPTSTTNNTDLNQGINASLLSLLSKAVLKQDKNDDAPKKPPTYMSELCFFDGDPINWIPFISHYKDTASFFSGIENVARIRKALKGLAKDTVKSLLYTSTSPDIILKELERRFGQPTYIIKSEIATLDRLPRMSEDIKGIGAFASAVFNSVNTIKQLNRKEYLYSTDISDRIINKMSTIVRFRWQEYKCTKTDEPILSVLSEFLNMISDQFDEPSFRFKSKIDYNKARPTGKGRVNTTNHEVEYGSDEDSNYDSEFEEEMRIVLAASTVDEEKCFLCEQTHDITKCQQFTKENVKKRWEIVKKYRMCFKCLKINHRHVQCRSKPCGKDGCTRTHHELLHEDKSKPEPNKLVSVNHVGTSKTFLKIVPVELSGPNGTETVMALLDEGSTVTLLTDEVADNIGAKGPERSLSIEGISGHQIKTERSRSINIRIKGLFSRHYDSLQAHTIKQLNLMPQSVKPEDLEDCPHLDDISDQLIYDGTSPSLLIGQDNWHLIVTRQIKAGHSSKPVASLTCLGWILHGCKTETPKPVVFINHTKAKEPEDINKLIKNHFDLDSLGITQRKPTNDPEQRALDILQKTTHRLPEGRFECGLLWKTDDETMPINRGNALRRLKGLERKFTKDQNFKISYTEQIRKLLDSGYAELATTTPISPRTWYLPHFGVTHPQKGKLRVVFDAAERTNGKSLNDALLPGPDLLQSLFGVLIRFRQGPIAIAADIKEMFLRVVMREEDRDSLRFLWKENETDEHPKEYRMKSLIFGATSSPCSAIFVKNRNAEDFKEKYPEAIEAIKRCHYMDDYLQSFATTKEAIKICNEVDLIHKSGGFELRQWTSNEPAVIKKFNSDSPDNVNLGDQDKYGKTLGMIWQTNNDALRFTVNLRHTPDDVINETRLPTKREVTSAVMSVFDPLGLATPVLIQGKTLIQELWRTDIDWDDHIPLTLKEHWIDWLKNLDHLRDLNVPRCTNSHNEGELHTFVDASETVYAAATYWRTTCNNKVKIKLMAAKAKVAPLKPTSIPRLELQAALLGSRLASNIANEIDATIQQKYYWSDSRTVLAWIKSDPRTFKAFVAHRLAEIEELTRPSEWRYVPTKLNVADDATRQLRNFNHTHRWFNGPDFLKHEVADWPKDHSQRLPEPTGEERTLTATTTTSTQCIDPSLPDVKRFSSWTRYLRASARFLQSVKRFKALIEKPKTVAATKPITKDRTWKPYEKTKRLQTSKQIKEIARVNIKIPPISHEYIELAEKKIIQQIQNDSFKTEIQSHQKNKKLNKNSRLKRLTVVYENDILYLETRLSASSGLAMSYRRPIILDGKHLITRLLVTYYHNEYNHGNNNTIMNEIRQKYYITSLRSTVKIIARECQWCKTHKAVPTTAPLGDLPVERLQQKQYPFTCTAVDYFGPITITVGRKTDKRWIALYTCLTTRAVHLEIAKTLSADNMILTLRRMISRRGKPKILYSDNGTNFVGANKELQLEYGKMIEKTEEKGIKWKFIPPGAPHMGGAWERLVRSVKTALITTLNTRRPQEDILHTLLLEAEHLINSRPITEISLDPDDQESLTPNHFLIGRSSGTYRMGDFTDHELIGPATWKTVQRLADHFWKRWLIEYLPTITPRYNTQQNGFLNPTVGDIVIIVDHSLPRGSWPKGEIITTYPGPDGKTRIVDVRTTAGILKRPASRLVKISQSSSLD
ncbi:uncharacterized protein LOC112057126 [Bicyclus anynana]|uniref:Uncharacterized protein LOC112057126 n=1 Tax=Bicyclus anynana TaxID=110368 RepID=A0A6J1P6H0_BICAN|nr:uncharacterized protein LOC112057126 [Bicyclus anynana]